MNKIIKKIIKFLSFSLPPIIVILFITQLSFASGSLNWNDTNVYKPKPVLFLHGFAKGNPNDWLSVKSSLVSYFSKYSNIYSYLEYIDFLDPNGSVDRYPSGKFNPQGNSAGWADKVNNKVNGLLNINNYGSYTNKLNLVCHSMGGLAARWYLANYSDDFIDKLILIGVPNLGTRWAELANTASKVPKVGWMQLLSINGIASLSKSRDALSFVLSHLEDIDIYGEAVKDMDPTSGGSGFINSLNSVSQTNKVSYYGVVGIISSFMNRVIANGDYYGGDGIVSKTSQLGAGAVTYKEWAQVDAIHWEEIEKAGSGSFSPIFYFLDSTPPEFTLDTPQENSTTEINTNSISIKGKVYKEYLPADSEIIISGIRQEDGAALNQINALLKPSSLWIPNNPDSPVAEFDETIPFPGEGTYRISCQIKNPAGLTSDTKVFWIKVVLVQPNANIIVHCHNPEGKEINSIPGFTNNVAVYNGSTRIGYAGNNPITLPSGRHTINVKFNGMTLTQEIDILGGETQNLTFTFTRTSVDINSLLSGSFSATNSQTWSRGAAWMDFMNWGIWGMWSARYNIDLSALPAGFPADFRMGVYNGVGTFDPISGFVSFPQMNIPPGPGPQPFITYSALVSGNISLSPSFLNVTVTYNITYPETPVGGEQDFPPTGPYVDGRVTKNCSGAFPVNPGFNDWYVQRKPGPNPPDSSGMVYVSYRSDILDVEHPINGGNNTVSLSTATPWNYLQMNVRFFGAAVISPSGSGTWSILINPLGKISNVPYVPEDI